VPGRGSAAEKIVKQCGDFERELDRAALLYEELVAGAGFSARTKR
jgi:hypothetical protein